MHSRSQDGTQRASSPPILSTSASLTTVASVESGPSLALSSRSPWLPILEASNQLVLYNPTSHALSITAPSLLPVPVTTTTTTMSQGWMRHADASHDHTLGHNMSLQGDDGSLATVPVRHQFSQFAESINGGGELRSCPWCSRPFSPGFGDIRRDGFSRRAPNYFQLLEQANYEAHSRPVSPPQSPPAFLSPLSPEPLFHSESNLRSDTPDSGGPSFEGGALDALRGVRHRLGGGRLESSDSIPGTPKQRFGDSSMAQGYFAAFFREERRLGMGANGSVFLCQVRLCIVYGLLRWLILSPSTY
jgi:hypothetical protein